MNWLNKLERKYGRYAIHGLMTYIVGISAAVFLYAMFGGTLISYLTLDPALVLRGQIWRLITFIFIPQGSSIFVIFTLYLFYMIGNALESEWGSFKFNLYYLIGVLATIVGAFISNGDATALFLNLSLFLAFARIYPDFELLIFFILPVKVKYLAWIDWLFLALTLVSDPSLGNKIAVIAAVVNFFIFFGGDIINNRKRGRQVYNNRKKFRQQIPRDYAIHHRCTVCGITDREDPKMEFRYCSKCDGKHAYCSEHIRNHEHIKEDPEAKVIQFQPREKDK